MFLVSVTSNNVRINMQINGSVALVNGANLDPGKTFVQSLFAASDAKTYAAAPLPRRSHSPGQRGATSNAID